jgi:ABC-type polysaccharide/polyol phosphate transport system ATPase subunit/ABC-type polysaccharide/polyol phosphate export permease
MPAITVSGVSKSFVVPHERTTTVKERLLSPFGTEPAERLQALRNVSFEVQQGEFFGIVGRNGHGKSTLLRCIAGIYPVDSGAIAVRGRLTAFIELGAGFHAELTARDNILASAVVFGIGRREAAAKVEEVLAFAELEPFANQKLKHFSSGMAVRLAFAITTHVEADVLAFDEVLAVGDAAFKTKCFDYFARLREEGKTIVLVTHDMATVNESCDRALLLHRGEVLNVGQPEEVTEQYLAINAGEMPVARQSTPPPPPRPIERQHGWRTRVFGKRPRHFLDLVKLLAVTDFRLKYLDTHFSYAWAIGRPLALFGVMYLVFSNLGRFDNGVPHYAAYLFMSIVLWTFFAQATDGSVWALVRRTDLLRKLPFPQLAAPLSHVTTSLIDLLANLVVVIAFAIMLGVEPTSSWLQLPVLLVVLTVFATGFAFLLSALFVRHRDVNQIWSVALQILFFASPLFYAATSIPAPYDRIMILLNPIAVVLTQARHALIDPTAPTAAEIAGGYPFLLCPMGIVVATLAIGFWVFVRESPHAAEHV